MAMKGSNAALLVRMSSVSGSAAPNGGKYGTAPAATQRASIVLSVGTRTAAGARLKAVALGNSTGWAICPTTSPMKPKRWLSHGVATPSSAGYRPTVWIVTVQSSVPNRR